MWAPTLPNFSHSISPCLHIHRHDRPVQVHKICFAGCFGNLWAFSGVICCRALLSWKMLSFFLTKQQLGLVAGGVDFNDFNDFYQWLHGCWAKTSRAMSGSWWFCLRWWQQRREEIFGRHTSFLCYDVMLGQTVVRMKGFWSEPLVSTTCWIHEAPTIPYDHCGSEGQIYALILAVSAKTQSASRGTTQNISETYPVSRKNTTKKETRSKYKEGT